jgi:hypothetical protein
MYIKPGPNFKMSKQTKRSLALIIDPQERGAQRRIMVQAELAAAIQPRREKRNDRPQGNFIGTAPADE